MEVSDQLPAPAAAPLQQHHPTHWTGGWVGCRAGPDVLEKRKSVASAGNQTLDRRPARSIIAMLML